MNFYLHKNAPRWIVFLLDMGAIAASLVVAYLLRFNFSVPEYEVKDFPIVLLVVLSVKALSFFFFKPYSGIIRHTSLNDFLRITLSLLFASVILSSGNIIRLFFQSPYLIPFSIIIIDFLLSMYFMGALRVMVKLLFQEMQRSSKDKTYVIIYGAGESGLTTKRALDRVTDTKYVVLAFFDDNTSKIGKRLEGVPIYSGGELTEFLTDNELNEIIIAVQQMDSEKKSKIVEAALQHKIKVLSVPPVTDWINGEINVRQIKNIRIEDLLGRKPIQLDQAQISKQIKGKVVLVTGAAGSIGSGLVRQIVNYFPEKIILLDQAESPLYEIELELKDNFGSNLAEIVIGDIRDYARMENVFRTFRPHIVYHAAAYKHVPLMEENPAEAVKTNVQGTKNIVDLSSEFGAETFVMVSTDKAVNPTNVMGASKRIAEIYAQAKNTQSKNTKYITTRFGNVLGSNGSVIPLFRKQMEKGGPLTVTHPEITRFFMTIPEACQLVLEAGSMGKGGEIFIFDMGKSIKIVDLAKKMIQLSGLQEGRDIQIKYTGMRPGEKLYEELLADKENTLKTHHPKIMVAKVRTYDFEQISNQICALIELYNKQQNFDLVRKMKEIVPEFISKNSVYSNIDLEDDNQ
jgi:FlaA1/EpsC-like NDP-sugar epimerase